jgi:TonB family protein
MAVSPRWRAEPARSRASRWRTRLGWVVIVSLLLHASVVGLVLIAPAPPKPDMSDVSPPGEVALVFHGGSNVAPTSPAPSPEATLGPPKPEKEASAPPAGSVPPPDAVPAPPPPVAAAPPLPPSVASSAASQAPSQADELPVPPVPPAPSAVPPPPPQVAMLPAAPQPAPSPPPAQAGTIPPPPVVPPTVVPPPRSAQALALPRLQPPHSAPRPPPPRPRVAEPRPDAFPKPLNFAFGSAFDGQGSIGHAPPHESLGPVAPGPTSRSAFNSDISGDIGPDYRNLLRAWMERHKYYPRQAAENGEDGTASVRVMIHKDGRVTMVDLEQRSGSVWLDAGAQAMFRDQRLPPFPSDAMGEQQEVTVTIHYILIRG